MIMKALRNLRGLKNLEVTLTKIASPFYHGDYVQDLMKAVHKSSSRLAQFKLAFQDPPSSLVPEDVRGSFKNWMIHRLNILQKLTLHLPISTLIQSNSDLERYIDLSQMKVFHKLKSLDMVLIHRPSDQDFQINPNELYFDPNQLFPNVKHFTWAVISSPFSDAAI